MACGLFALLSGKRLDRKLVSAHTDDRWYLNAIQIPEEIGTYAAQGNMV
jgi:hypothetical protein